jgi:hypothetical protein
MEIIIIAINANKSPQYIMVVIICEIAYKTLKAAQNFFGNLF